MTTLDFAQILHDRIDARRNGVLDVRSRLQHFALINYALPKERLARYIPEDRFEIPEFEIDGKPMALMSAVPFYDSDFHFIHLFPFLRFAFGQTNYRAYVIDRATGEHAVWFFGTTLGSPLVNIPVWLWKIPWRNAKYKIDCEYSREDHRYHRYVMGIRSEWASAEIDIEDTGEALVLESGFESEEAMALILTHPVDGFFYRGDKRLGTYSVWHKAIRMTRGKAKNLYFSLYERLGLLSRAEMQQPHSIFLCPETEFRVYLPPYALPESA
ncbi:MAG: DUF2071 domain-containing protein [Capsulimonas sp.]|uniref:DUF2071 domain-containing protein n=1 Tax=Capsulimonas sp. TaxID=2494211 RepID=UPI0032672EAD